MSNEKSEAQAIRLARFEAFGEAIDEVKAEANVQRSDVISARTTWLRIEELRSAAKPPQCACGCVCSECINVHGKAHPLCAYNCALMRRDTRTGSGSAQACPYGTRACVADHAPREPEAVDGDPPCERYDAPNAELLGNIQELLDGHAIDTDRRIRPTLAQAAAALRCASAWGTCKHHPGGDPGCGECLKDLVRGTSNASPRGETITASDDEIAMCKRAYEQGRADERRAGSASNELFPLAVRIEKGRQKYPTGCTVLSLLDEAGEVAHAVNKRESLERVRDELLDVAAVAMRLYAGEIDTAWQPTFGAAPCASISDGGKDDGEGRTALLRGVSRVPQGAQEASDATSEAGGEEGARDRATEASIPRVQPVTSDPKASLTEDEAKRLLAEGARLQDAPLPRVKAMQGASGPSSGHDDAAGQSESEAAP